MPKKYYNKVAIGTYAALLLSAASFVIQFVYEGWGIMGTEPLMSPLGIAAITIGVFAIGLFVWNLRREELTHEQWQPIVRDRRKPLDMLDSALEQYKNVTAKIAENNILYNLETYDQPDILSLFRSILDDNLIYARLKSDDINGLSNVRAEIDNLLSKVGTKKLRKMVREFFRREHIARSYQVFLTIYRTQFNPHPKIERRIHRSGSIGAIEDYLGKVRSHIGIMKRGKDLD